MSVIEIIFIFSSFFVNIFIRQIQQNQNPWSHQRVHHSTITDWKLIGQHSKLNAPSNACERIECCAIFFSWAVGVNVAENYCVCHILFIWTKIKIRHNSLWINQMVMLRIKRNPFGKFFLFSKCGPAEGKNADKCCHEQWYK